MAARSTRGFGREQLKSPGTAVQFRIRREAGTLNCEGFLKNGSGGGVFSFVVNRGFMDSMSTLGFSGLRDDQVFAMAIHDVTTSYVKNIRAEGISITGNDQLIAMKIHGVEAQYVREMKRVGLSSLSADNLIAMRIHGVTPEFARDLKQLGYTSLTTDQLVAMRIHGASIEFVRQLDKLGYEHPSIDQLVAMRIHGVTPELIQKLQQRGLKDLSIDHVDQPAHSRRCELMRLICEQTKRLPENRSYESCLGLCGHSHDPSCSQFLPRQE